MKDYIKKLAKSSNKKFSSLIEKPKKKIDN